MKPAWHHAILPALALTVLAFPYGAQAFSPDVVARAVRAFFPEAPQMVAVARCESGLRQYDASGRTLRGGWGNKMIGLFQLHETYHRAAALARGYDIDTLVGNILYARTLYAAEGVTPWNSSRHCWEHAPETVARASSSAVPASASVAATPSSLTKTLHFGMADPEVRVLHELLARAGHPVAAPETESMYFGVQTYKALHTFQCARGIACLSVPELRSGAGVVDQRTRDVLSAL